MASTAGSSEKVEQLRGMFSGSVLGPDDPGYDEARAIHNGMVDRRPALIARCVSTADIADAVRHAREAGVDICVRGGGHNVAGRELAPFLGWGPPLIAEVGQMPYWVMNTLLDDHYRKGALNYWLSSFTSGLSDGLIDTAIERFRTVPSTGTVMLFEHFHGAVCRIPVADTAVPHQEEGWNLLIPGVWHDPAANDEHIAWVKDTHAALGEHLEARHWLNYLGDDQGDDAVSAAYGPNYGRLQKLKRRCDPDNVFHHNHNIKP